MRADWLATHHGALVRYLVTHRPEAWLLRPHVLFPCVVLLYVVTLTYVLSTPISIHSVPDAGIHLVFGALAAIAIAAAWIFFVVRDARVLWPQHGYWGQLIIVTSIFFSLLPIVGLPLLYSEILSTRELAAFRHAIELSGMDLADEIKTLSANYEILDKQSKRYGFPLAVSPSDLGETDDAAPERPYLPITAEPTTADDFHGALCAYARATKAFETKAIMMNEGAFAAGSGFRRPTASPSFMSTLDHVSTAKDEIRIRLWALTCVVVITIYLAGLVVMFRDASFRFGLSMLAVATAYTVIWATAINLAKLQADKWFWWAFILHYGFWVGTACFNRVRHVNTWYARGVAVVLSLMSPILPIAILILLNHKFSESQGILVTLGCCVVYLLVLPLLQNNLVRFRYLPRP